MRTHIIPRKYLEGFTNKDGKIWTYRKGFSHPFPNPPEKTAVIKNFYSDETETFLNEKVEYPALETIIKIKNGQNIAQDDKGVLSKYLVNMIMRVPDGKTWVKKNLPSVISQVFDERNLMGLVGGRYLSVHEKVKLTLLRLEWEVEQKEETIESLWESQLSQDYAQSKNALEEMTWQFLTYDSAPVFVTSDNPLFFFKSIGIGNQLAEITFPLSYNVVLWATWAKDELPIYAPISKKIVDEINLRTICGRTHEIYSPVQAHWVAKLAKVRKHRPRRIVSTRGLAHSLEQF